MQTDRQGQIDRETDRHRKRRVYKETERDGQTKKQRSRKTKRQKVDKERINFSKRILLQIIASFLLIRN
jgi:hypothetical protein